MQQKIRYLILVQLFCIACNAQYYRPENKVWAMGRYVGLDFNQPGDPAAINTNMRGANDEGCAAISDTSGNLLFYSNGWKVWCSDGSLMPNGNTVNGFSDLAPTATQGALITPSPRKGQYYLFTLVRPGTPAMCRLYCSLIDMDMNNSLGDIDTSFELNNIPIIDSLSEKMIAIPGCNGNIWLILHSETESKFITYDLSKGFTTPVISYVNPLVNGTDFFFGQLKASPNWDKIAMCASKALTLYDFDRGSGIVTGGIVVDSNSNSFYTTEFSPDGSKLYSKSALPAAHTVYQYDLNADNPILSRDSVTVTLGGWMSMKLGPDGKIYMASYKGQTSDGFVKMMQRINAPDNSGIACNVEDSIPTFYLENTETDSISGLAIGLPNLVVLPVYEPGTATVNIALDTFICDMPANGVTLTAAPAYPYRVWSTNDTAASITINQNGTYWVRYPTFDCNTRTDTFKISNDLPPIVIVLNNDTLSTEAVYISYQWYYDGVPIENATTRFCPVTDKGIYSVAVTGAGGCTDSSSYNVDNTGITGISGGQLKVYPNPARSTIYIESPISVNIILKNVQGRELITGCQKNEMDISRLADGLYFLYLTDKKGRLLKIEKLAVRH